LVAIGGVNIDPYFEESSIARVRHVYVLSDWRNQGIGKQLIQAIIDKSQQQFRLLTLRTFNKQAADFYRAIGFQTEPEIKHATHHLILKESEVLVEKKKDATAIMQAEKQLAEAHLSLDINVISNLLHADYVILQPGGIVETKEDVLASYRAGERNWDKAFVDDLTIRLYGDTGIVNGRWQASGQNNGKQFDYVAKFLSVWIFQNGSWQNIAYHSTEIT
jgi:N-acetylglutamate synthase-like GNAT family acetyltransferase